jgi:hypothetical protein
VYADWLPAPSDLDGRDHYYFFYGDVEDIEANEDRIDESYYDPASLENAWSPLELGTEDVSQIIAIASSLAVEAEFDRDGAISTLEDEDFEEDSEYSGYTLMLGEFDDQVFAVGDGVLVVTDEIDTAETIIDASGGDGERYDEASDDMATLVGALGGGTAVSGSTMDEPDQPDPENGQFENMVAKGERSRINGETAELAWVVVCDSEDDVDTDDLEEWVDANDGFDEEFDGVEDISYDSDGRTGIITGTADTADL